MDAAFRYEDCEILVVDDNPNNLLVIEAALAGLAGNLVLAKSGEEALRLLLERDFALILLDVQMPRLDGLETAQLIRRRARSRHVPIIFVTAFDQGDDDVLAAYRLGAVDFLFKPVHTEILRAKVSAFVELRRRSAQIAHQARRIQEHERDAFERALSEQRRRMEAEALRKSLAEQRRHARELMNANAELVTAREQLERINGQLAGDDRRKDEFLAMLAHELRNPLAALASGLSNLRIAEESGQGATLEVRGIMERQCEHLCRLVDDLLDISRVKSGKMKLRRERIPVEEAVQDAIKLASAEIDRHGHALDVRCDARGVRVDGDRTRLAQMIGNLLVNASRYTEGPGRIQVCAERTGDGRIRVRVVDNGLGMPEDMLAHVFDLFVQGDSGNGGLGIGLTLVRELATLHGGTVSAHSDGPGKGSVFEIVLPEAPAELAGEAPRPAPQPIERPLRVVLVDDNEDLRSLTRALLEHHGHTIYEAGTGLSGVECIASEMPDVAVVDIGLPDIDGHEVARRLRDRLGPECPRLVAMTGFSRSSDFQTSGEVGFDAHLVKPAEEATLRAALQGPVLAAPTTESPRNGHQNGTHRRIEEPKRLEQDQFEQERGEERPR